MDQKKKIQETLKRSTLRRGVSDTDDYLLDCLGALSHKSRIQEYYTSFVPGTRDWVFESFQEWLLPPSEKQQSSVESSPPLTKKKKKVFVFAAEAGMGKTAASAKLVVDYSETIVGHHFCQHDKTRTSNAKRMLMSLAAQLSARLDSYKEELFELLQAENTDPKALQQEFLNVKSYNVASLFQLLFLDPLAAADVPEEETPLVFLIDALDEVDRANGKNEFVDCIQLNFHKLPDWLRVFVTTRPESPMAEVQDNNIVGRFKAFNTFLLQPSDRNNAKDLETFYHFHLSEVFPEDSERQAAVKVLMSKTKGSFIYAKYAVEKIMGDSGNKLNIKSLELFPDGLQDFYEEQLRHRVLGPELSEHGKYKESLEWKAIQLILVAAEPLHTTLLQLLLDCSESKAEQVMEHLSTFFLKHSGHLQVYHKSLKDWITSDEQRHGGNFFVETQSAEALLGDRCLEVLKMVLDSLAVSLPTDWSMPELPYSQESVCYVLQFALQHIFRGNMSSSITTAKDFLYDQNVSYVLARIMLADDYSNLVSDLLQLGKKAEDTLFHFGRALQLSQDTIRRNGWQHLPSQLVGRLRGPASEGETGSPQKDLFLLVVQWNSYHYGFPWWSPKVPTWPQADGSCLQAIMTESEVLETSFSPDGSKIACGLQNGNIIIYSVGDGTFDTLEGHTDSVNSMSWSPFVQDMLASGSKDKTVRVWSCNSGRCKFTLEGHNDWVLSVAWSPLDRDLLASGSDDKMVRIWNCKSGKCKCTLEGHTNLVRSVVWSPFDQDLLASGSNDKTVRIWSCKSGNCEQTLAGHTNWVNSVAWSPLDRDLLASGSSDQTVCIWSCKSGNCERTLEGHTHSVRSVAWSPLDQDLLVSGSDDKTVHIWSFKSGKCKCALEGHTGMVRSVAWSHLDRDLLASGSFDKMVRIWSCKTGINKHTLEGHTGWVRSVAWSPVNQDLLATGSEDKTLRIWSCKSGNYEGTLEGHTGSVESVSWSPLDRNLLASGSSDETVRVWSCNSGRFEFTLEGHNDWVRSVAWSPLDPDLLASGSDDNTVCIWSCKSGKCKRRLQGHSNWVNSVAWSPLDRDLLASGSKDKTVRVWSCKSGNCECTLEGHTGWVEYVSWSPLDRDLLATRSDDKTVRIWNCKSGNCKHTLERHTAYVRSLAWSPLDPDLLASGSNDKTVCIWSIKSGKCVCTLEGHTNRVLSVAWSPIDWYLLASGSDDKTVCIWSCKSGRCISVLHDQNWQNVDDLDWNDLKCSYDLQEAGMISTASVFEEENQDSSINSSQILPLDGIKDFFRCGDHAVGVWDGKHMAFFELKGLDKHCDENVSQENDGIVSTDGVFSRKKWLSDLLNAAHPVAPSLALEKPLVNKFCHPPVDVFCIHTGVQKNVEVATMVDILTKGGFECFFDREMSMNQGAPTAQMAMALETCRHAVVVLSKAFLQKMHPCSELCYVFERMHWLRNQYKCWESVRVVLYDLTVEDYKEEQRSSLRSRLLPPLPDLGPDVVMTKWEAGMTWPRLCHELKGDLIEHDNDRATGLWSKFLEECYADKFPRALDIYKEPPNMKRPSAQDPPSPHPREPKALKN